MVVNLLDQKLWNQNPDFFSYTLSKAALEAANTMLALALAPQLRVVGVAPGLTLTSHLLTPEKFEALHQLSPLGRSSTAADVAATVRFALENAVHHRHHAAGRWWPAPDEVRARFFPFVGTAPPCQPDHGNQTLTLTGLRFDANLGILESEKTAPQPIQVDAELSLGPQPLLPHDDDIHHVLDYRKVRQIIIERVHRRTCQPARNPDRQTGQPPDAVARRAGRAGEDRQAGDF